MQARAADDLKKMVTDRLVAAGLVYEGAKAFATPRRLALSVHGVPPRQPDIKEEKKGPRVGAPENAIAGLLKAAGLKSIYRGKSAAGQEGRLLCRHHREGGTAGTRRLGRDDPGSGAFVSLAEVDALGLGPARFWVRPLHSILATFGPETEDPDVVKFDVDGIAGGDETRGHRFMAPARSRCGASTTTLPSLEKAKVVLDPARRSEDDPHRRQEPCLRTRLRTGRGRGLLTKSPA